MRKSKYEIAEIYDHDLNVDLSLLTTGSVYFNATEIAKHFNKDLQSFMRTPETIKYIELIKADFNSVLKTDLKVVLSKRGRANGGTWMHNSLALHFARWCSTEFAFKLDKWIVARFKEEEDRKLSREKARMEYRPMTDAIKLAHDDPKFYHYSNEADMINRIVLGVTARKFKEEGDLDDVRNGCTFDQIACIEKAQKTNTSFIELGFSFEDRQMMLDKLINGKSSNTLKLIK